MSDRDRLTADLADALSETMERTGVAWPARWVHADFAWVARQIARPIADLLLALGWTRLDEDRLGRALRLVEDAGTIVLLGTDTRTDEDGLPLRNDYSGVDAECAVAIVKAYREDAP